MRHTDPAIRWGLGWPRDNLRWASREHSPHRERGADHQRWLWLRWRAGGAITSIAYDFIPQENQPQLTATAINANRGEGFFFSGQFTSPTQATGQAHINWQGRTHCDDTLDCTWTITKQAVAIQPAVVTQPKTGPGGPANCREVIIQILIFGLFNGALLTLNAIGITLMYIPCACSTSRMRMCSR